MHEKIKRSLHYSTLDGIFASMMTGFSETFMTPYALAMGAGTALIGVLASVPNLVGAFLQIASAPLAERLGSRQRLINPMVLVNTLMWVPIILIPFVAGTHAMTWLIVLYTALIASNMLAVPAWSSMMADHVSETERGRILGRRNVICGLTNVASMLAAGVILFLCNTAHRSAEGSPGAFTGFAVIFSIAFLARIVSWYFLRKMYEPPLHIAPEHRFTIIAFFRKIGRSNFGRFVIFVSVMNFSVTLSGPFLAVYMLRDIGFSYLTYTIITMTANLAIFGLMHIWGAHADHVGNRRVLRLATFCMSLIPLLWLLSHNVGYLLCVQVFAGFFWGGFNLSATNFIYDAVRPEKRTRCIAYFNVCNGCAIFFGALIGGLLVNVLPPMLGYRILSLFVISAIARFATTFFLATFKEVRQVKKVSNVELFYSVTGLRPILPSLTENA